MHISTCNHHCTTNGHDPEDIESMKGQNDHHSLTTAARFDIELTSKQHRPSSAFDNIC